MLMAEEDDDMWGRHNEYRYDDDDDLTIDIQAIMDILDHDKDPSLQNCSEDFSAGKVQQVGLPELESATSVGTDFAEPAAFSPSYNSEASDSRISIYDITAEGVGNPLVSDHRNQEPAAHAAFSGTLSGWTFPASGLVAGANTLIHDFPSHGVNNLDESHHRMPNFVPPSGFALEYQFHDGLMEKLDLNHAEYFDLSEYTGMPGSLDSAKTSSMDIGVPIRWEPPDGYNHQFIQNGVDVSNLTDEWDDLSSQTTAVYCDEVFEPQVAKIGATTLGEKVTEESDISRLNVKCEDHIRALSVKQSPVNFDNGLGLMSHFMCDNSADIRRNKHVVSLEKESGNNLVSTGMNLSSYVGSHNKSPTANGIPAGRSLSQTFLPRLSSNPSRNILGRVKDEQKDFSLLSKKSRQSYVGISESAHRKPNRVVGDHFTDAKALEQPYHQPFTPMRRLYCKNDESVAEMTQPLSNNCHFSKVSSQTTHATAIVSSFEVDDDPDVCIIEGLSAPVQSNPCSMNRKPLVSSQYLAISDPLDHVGIGGVKLKSNDERLVLRVALQDLSQPKTEASPPHGVMAVPLLKHQRIALSWMVQKETASLHCCGGILADDQGLGKTISTIALIVKEKPPTSSVCTENHKQIKREMHNLDEDDDCVSILGGHEHTESSQESSNRSLMSRSPSMQSKGRPYAGTLVVCPTSVLRQWADELRDKITQRAKLSVLVYHGSNRTKDPCELARYDVVLTTYSIVSMEVPTQPLAVPSSKKRKYSPTSKKKSKEAKESDNLLLESCARPLARVGWFRVVLDEAQSIKNHRTQVARACWGLRAKRRWCLSGTPIQNSVDDLFSYFRFLRYDPYATYKLFCSSIKVPITRNPATGYKKLQAILKTVMLRRTKGTLLDGEPIINLPPKSVELKKVDFTTEERDFYCQLEADSRAQFEEYAAAGTVKQNYVNILLLLLRLRQACDHPLLVKGCDSTFTWRSSAEMAKKLPREKQLGLLSCLEASLAICGLCSDPPEDAVVTSCGHVFCNQCICEHLMGDDNQCPNINCKDRLSVSLVFSSAALKCCLSEEPCQDATPSSSGSEVSDKVQSSSWGPSFESSKIKTALEVLKSISDPKPSTLEVLKAPSNPEPPIHDVPSLPKKKSIDPFEIEEEESDTDIDDDKDANLVGGSKEQVKVNGEKAIVFSQWTRMLDLLEAGLKSSSIQYRRLDGTMSVLARERAVNDFKTLPEVTVIIMSLKAASLGLNMVAACHVILLDLWWNPTTEDQAVDRAHRIGQTRPVSVLRLTVKDTVEDRILALQQKKREMVASAFGEDETGGNQARLTVEDLKYLFMV